MAYQTRNHHPTFARFSNSCTVCRRLPALHQYSKSQPLSVGIFLPVPPVKTPLASRASRPGRCVFRPDSRKLLSLLSVGTRALATTLLLFSMTYRQQVREVIWSGGGESKKGLARYAELTGVGVGSCGLRRRPWRRYSAPFSLSVAQFSPFQRPLKPAKSSSTKYNTALNQ